MEYESSSPFDQAVKHPLLSEPVHATRWTSWWKLSSSSIVTPKVPVTDASLPRDDDDETTPVMEIQFVPHHNTTPPPPSPHSEDNDDASSSLWMDLMEEGSLWDAQDLETAVLQERHQGVQHVHAALVEIHQIQTDLALVVQNQSEQVNELQEHVHGAVVQAARGLSHLAEAATRRRQRQERLRRAAWKAIGAALFVFLLAGGGKWQHSRQQHKDGKYHASYNHHSHPSGVSKHASSPP